MINIKYIKEKPKPYQKHSFAKTSEAEDLISLSEYNLSLFSPFFKLKQNLDDFIQQNI